MNTLGKGWRPWRCDACKVSVAFWFKPVAMARLQVGNVFAKCEGCAGLEKEKGDAIDG